MPASLPVVESPRPGAEVGLVHLQPVVGKVGDSLGRDRRRYAHAPAVGMAQVPWPAVATVIPGQQIAKRIRKPDRAAQETSRILKERFDPMPPARGRVMMRQKRGAVERMLPRGCFDARAGYGLNGDHEP